MARNLSEHDVSCREQRAVDSDVFGPLHLRGTATWAVALSDDSKFWPPKQLVPLLRFSSPSGMRSSGRDDNFATGYSAGENALGGCRKNRPGREKPATSSKMCPRLGARGDSLDDHLGFRLRWPSVVLLIQNRLPVPAQRLQQVAVGFDHLVEAADVGVHVGAALSDRREHVPAHSREDPASPDRRG